MNLTFQCLFQGMNDLARQAGLKVFQVQFKKNADGEAVFALIISDTQTSLDPKRPNDQGSHLA